MHQLMTALDLGTSKIAIAQAALDDDGKMKVIGAASADYPGFRLGTSFDYDAIVNAVLNARAETSRKSGKMIRQMLVGVPGEFLSTYMKTITMTVDGIVTQNHLDRLLSSTELSATGPDRVVLHKMALAFSADGVARSNLPIGERVEELTVCVSVVESESYFHDFMEELLNNLGISVAGYIASPVATAAAVLQQEQKKDTALLIDVGHFSSDITIARPEGLIYTANLNAGGNDITLDLATALDIDYYEAQQIKHKQSPSLLVDTVRIGDNLYTIQSIMDARIRTIVKAIQNTLITSGYEWDELGSIYLLGGGIANVRGGRELLSVAFGRNVKIFPAMSALISGNTCNTAISILLYYLQYIQTLKGESFFTKIKRSLFNQ